MKLLKLLLLLNYFFLNSLCYGQFTQLGLDIDGEDIGDNSGKAVSLNSNGTILAIGAPLNSDSLSSAGHVRVYEWNGSNWTQKGNDINGKNSYDEFGSSLSLNTAGTILAIGAPTNSDSLLSGGQVRVYEWNGNTWLQKGLPINGQNNYDEFGRAVSLSEDGTTLAIGAPLNDDNGNNSGNVIIYEWSGNVWTQKGGKLIGNNDDDLFGSSVSLNNNGSTLAVGAPNGQSSSLFPLSNGGHAKVYEWAGSNWSQRGTPLYGGGWFGGSISLNGNGNVVAVGAPNDRNGLGIGFVAVSLWDGSSWVQQGADIEGDRFGDGFGTSVSLSGNATIVAIGANEQSLTNTTGYAKVYEKSGLVWSQRSVNINAENSHDLLGSSVSISKNGNTLAVGAPLNDGNGISAGHVRAYDLTSFSINIDKVNDENTLDISIWPNPATDYLYIDKKNNENLSINLVDKLGRYYQSVQISEQISTIDFSSLPSGIYFIKIRSDKKITTKKILKK